VTSVTSDRAYRPLSRPVTVHAVTMSRFVTSCHVRPQEHSPPRRLRFTFLRVLLPAKSPRAPRILSYRCGARTRRPIVVCDTPNAGCNQRVEDCVLAMSVNVSPLSRRAMASSCWSRFSAFGRHMWTPRALALARPSPVRARMRLALELRQATEDGQHQTAVRRRGIGPCVGQRSEAGAAPARDAYNTPPKKAGEGGSTPDQTASEPPWDRTEAGQSPETCPERMSGLFPLRIARSGRVDAHHERDAVSAPSSPTIGIADTDHFL
jgi:hypothetical protein